MRNDEIHDGDDAQDDRGLTPELVREIRLALDAGDAEKVREALAELHAADQADLFELFDRDRRETLFRMVGDSLEPEALAEMDEPVRDALVEMLGPRRVAEAISTLDEDDAVYVLDALSEEQQRAVLNAVAEDVRRPLEEGLSFEEDSAGRLMQRDFVAVPAFWSMGQVIDHLRRTEDLPDEFYGLYVIDAAFKPIGWVPLDRAMRTKRPIRIGDIMDADPISLPVDMDEGDVAYQFRQYGLTSAPVVDDSGRMLGVVMVDDVVEIVEEEAEEDLFQIAGVRQDDLNISILRTTKSRFAWLLINLGTALLASAVIGQFDATIEAVVALAVLMPIVASMGGNAGTQTLAIAVRALATKDLTTSNALRQVSKELVVGGINGIAFAILIGLATLLWFQDPILGGVIAAAMVINMVVAGLAGILIPLGLDRAGVDPAISSAVFLTTITDIVGFFAFLGLGAWLLL
ncbi:MULTISPECIES: magnesium transporter [unclassified Minwuia]|jgi:magnesium transporter|uniref:magnesium transporter n=1 Tax=unclassified Minwuia TaxID=2618799 RepID=UPI0024784B62|nr:MULTISPECIES: magnesium transporter [unclassified Minwuia]